MTPLDLVQITLGLFVAALVFQPAPGAETPDAWIALRRALRDLMLNAACATALAAGLLWWLPIASEGNLGKLTLSELREHQKTTTEWLQRAWYLPMAGAAIWLAVALATGAAVWGVRSTTFGRSLTWGLRLKAVAGLVGLLAVTAIGAQARAQRLVDAQAAQIRQLVEARLVLANDALRAALVAVAEPMAAEISTVPLVATVAQAYWTAEPYLPVPRWPVRSRGFGAALADDVDRRADDLPADRIESLKTAFTSLNASLPDDPRKLVAVVVETAFDQGAAEPLREALLSIENPLLNELLGAALDPLLARPLREALVRLAVGAIGGNTPEQMQIAARTWWSGQPTPVRRRWQRAVANASSAWAARSAVPLGQPAWRAARARLDEMLGQREASATRPAQKGRAPDLGTASLRRPDWFQAMQADAAARRMARLWAALDPLLVDEPRRRVDAERAAAAAMLDTGRDGDGKSMSNYLALWGRALAETEGASTAPSAVLAPLSADKTDARAALLHYYASQGSVLANAAQRRLEGSRGGSSEALVAHLDRLKVDVKVPPPQTPVGRKGR